MESRLFPECPDRAGNGLDPPGENSKSRDGNQGEATRFARSSSGDNRIELRHLRTAGVVEPEDPIRDLCSNRSTSAVAVCSGRKANTLASGANGTLPKPQFHRGQSPHAVPLWRHLIHLVLSSSQPDSGPKLFSNSGWRCNLADRSIDVPALPLGRWSCGAL